MKHSGPSFCVLPWIHMNLNPDGVATLCCQSHTRIADGKGESLNMQLHSMQEIWNSPGMKDIRKKMSAGEQLPHCNACFNNERYGRESYRTYSNQRWLENHPKGESIKKAIEASADGSVQHKPLYFDIRLGNICNLKCTACKPLYSSQIERDPVHSKWITDAPYIRLENRFGNEGDWFDADALLTEITDMGGELSLIQLAGGEPTINKTQIAFLKSLCDKGYAKGIDLEVVTNMSNIRADIYDIFGQFKTLAVMLSIDGCNGPYEYVRFPGKWTSVVKNVARLREVIPNVRLSINCVLQAINAFNVIDLFNWADAENIHIVLSIGRGLDLYNDFRILPLALRAELKQRFADYFARKANQNMEVRKQSIASVFDEMDATDFTDEQRRERTLNFMHFINDLDKSRRLSFQTIVPDVYQMVVQYYGYWDGGTRFAA